MIKTKLSDSYQKIQHFLDGEPSSAAKEEGIPRLLACGIIFWVILWTVWPACTVGNLSIDVAENMEWGRHFQFGYDKNPYFGAWLSYYILRWIPGDWGSYLLSQLSVALGAIAVWSLGKEIFHSNFAALLAVALMALNPFFSQSALEFNDDVISISLWALTALFFFRSVKKGRLRDWCMLGVFAGLAVMTKYLAAVLLLALGPLLIFTSEGRKVWKKPGIYLAMLISLILILPNLIWLYQHDFIAFRYALKRADLMAETPSWMDHLRCPWKMTVNFFMRLIVPAAVMILLFRRGKKSAMPSFDRWFVLLASCFPYLFLLFFSFATGGNMRISWFTPFYVFSGLFLVWIWNPVSSRHRLRLLSPVILIFIAVLIFVCGYEFSYKRPYRKEGCGYNAFPGREAGYLVTEQWHQRFDRPLRFVIGPHTEACYISYFSPDHPESMFHGKKHLSPWIDLEKVARDGAVLVCEGDDPDFASVYRDILPGKLEKMLPLRLHRAAPAWISYFAGPTKEVVIHMAFLPPQDAQKNTP